MTGKLVILCFVRIDTIYDIDRSRTEGSSQNKFENTKWINWRHAHTLGLPGPLTRRRRFTAPVMSACISEAESFLSSLTTFFCFPSIRNSAKQLKSLPSVIQMLCPPPLKALQDDHALAVCHKNRYAFMTAFVSCKCTVANIEKIALGRSRCSHRPSSRDLFFCSCIFRSSSFSSRSIFLEQSKSGNLRDLEAHPQW